MNGRWPLSKEIARFTIPGLTPLFVCFLTVTSPASQVQTGTELRARVGSWVAAHEPEIIRELTTLLAIPNVAADRPNIRRNAEHLRGMLAARGFKAQLLETTGNPLVYGDLVVPGATRTLLLYSHYDGQPVDPKAWKQADPFTPVLRSARLDRGGKERACNGRPETLRSGVAPLCALFRGRQSADCRDLRGARRDRGIFAPPDLERARHPRW